jgi:CRISPR/Cas system-associated exonuclease Cas4 (RecB family)
MGFLEKIAGQFLKEYGSHIHKLAFVFPTHRAGIYFMRHIRNQKEPETTIWAPQVFSINDFIARLSELTVSDPLDLIFELYGVYKTHVRDFPKAFGDFYPWGKMIISDFNEIDKYLLDTVDTGRLFRTLKEFKAVEDITKSEKSDIHNRYTGFWEDLGILHREFNRLLREKNKAYEGMVFREVANNIETISRGKNGKGNVFAWEKVIFCGFNALTRAEETIIRYLLEKEKAEIYWDMDRYFVEDTNQEAGHFFRKNRETLEIQQPRWVDDQLSGQKNITIIGAQSKVSQAKVLGLKLRQMQESLQDPENTAVVLPDETLLFPVLNSLPESMDRVNITVGFPLQQTPVASLFHSIIEMQLRVYEGGTTPSKDSGEGFYYKDIRRVLNHPYIKPMAPEEIVYFIDTIKKENRVYVKEEEITLTSEFLKDLFKIRENAQAFIAFFLDVLDFIRSFYTENKPGLFSIDYEYIYHFYTLLTRLKDSLKSTGSVLDIRTFRQLFIDIVKGSRIPFTGEPLEGLQIMGMLETQTLDFANLFILSVNEGHLPPGRRHQSFIPFDVRREIGLPTYRDRDALSAYHFYRLLKNAQHITLFYTTEVKGVEKSEKSRFIDQVVIEYAEKNKNARVNHQIIDFAFETQDIKTISIKKSGKIIEMVSQKSYSSSSLLNYLSCSLRFYFTYILKLKEEEEVYESPDYRLVGHIIHKTLHKLYQPYCDKNSPISFKDIENIKKRIEPELIRTYKDELKSGDIHSGRNRIAFEVMKRFLENFFEKEKQNTGFKILMLEQKIEKVDLGFSLDGTEHHVRLEGTIDRLDVTGDNIYRIIDYKTGRIDSLNLKSMEQLSGSEAVNRKEVFQLFFYWYLLKQSHPYAGEYRLGIYPFKKMYDELTFVKIDKSDRIDEALLEAFEEILKKIFQELFDINIPFVQTEEEKNCQHCPYQDICCRETSERY